MDFLILYLDRVTLLGYLHLKLHNAMRDGGNSDSLGRIRALTNRESYQRLKAHALAETPPPLHKSEASQEIIYKYRTTCF